MPATDVYFPVLPGTMLMDLAGIAAPFRLAERFGGRFRLHFVGPAPLTQTYAGLTLQGIGEPPPSLPDGAVVFVRPVGARRLRRP